MTEPPATPEQLELLRAHRPYLQYSQDPYRICSPKVLVDTPPNELRRADGSVVCACGNAERLLSLDALARYPGDPGDPAPTDYLTAIRGADDDPPPLQDDPAYAHRVYGRVVDDGRGGRWLQYWFWIYWNQKRLLGRGAHEGDWEMIQIHLGPDGRPDRMTFAQHEHGEARRLGGREPVITQRGPDGNEHVVVFVAPFSHASYYTAGTKIYAGGTDNPDLSGPRVFPEVEPLGPWAEWPGRWGASRGRWPTRGTGNSPRSPGHQGIRWTHPDRYHLSANARKPFEVVLRALWGLGFMTYPHAPSIEPRLDGRTLHVDYELRPTLLRRPRHVLFSAHSGDRSLATHLLERAPRRGSVELELPDELEACTVRATAYNRLNQASDPAEREAYASGG